MYGENTDSSVITEDALDLPATSKVIFKNKRNDAKPLMNGERSIGLFKILFIRRSMSES